MNIQERARGEGKRKQRRLKEQPDGLRIRLTRKEKH